jgi:phosphatidylserine decarboxylase
MNRVSLQRLLPQHAVSRLAGYVACSPRRFVSQPLIRLFSRIYRVSLTEAERESAADYESFNDFFTRSLKRGARPMPEDPHVLIAPADGTLSQFGRIDAGTLMQAKGDRYPLRSLVLDSRAQATFDGGWFATIYLAPGDYHRVHVPFDATLTRSVTVPGELFSVNADTEAAIPLLFCRNERLVMHFKSSYGPLIVVMVGALIVASIETVFDAPASPYRSEELSAYRQPFTRGEELGRFLLGSTVIVIVPPGVFTPRADLEPGARIKVGNPLGVFSSAPN